MRQITTNDKSRIETGALKINDDWAGLFIRGDDCLKLMPVLEEARELSGNPFHRLQLSTLLNMMREAVGEDV